MDQDTLVIEQIDSGKRLIELLAAEGFHVRVAFWAKPTEDEKWYLYLASPFVDEKGPAVAYRLAQSTLRKTPELWIDLLEVKVIGVKDSLTEAILHLIGPKVPDSTFAVRNPRAFPGGTRLGSATLGGISFDRAYIYPQSQLVASTKG